jgi:hypothetical protein
MPLPLLEMAESQAGEFVASKPTGEQEGKQCSVTFALDLLAVWCLPKRLRLFSGQPVPSLTPSFFTPLTRRIPAAKPALSSPQSAAS